MWKIKSKNAKRENLKGKIFNFDENIFWIENSFDEWRIAQYVEKSNQISNELKNIVLIFLSKL